MSLRQQIGQSVLAVEEREQGYAFHFSADELAELAQMIGEERLCCPFLRFTLVAEPGHGPLWLEVTGPAGAKEFIGSLFDGGAWAM